MIVDTVLGSGVEQADYPILVAKCISSSRSMCLVLQALVLDVDFVANNAIHK